MDDITNKCLSEGGNTEPERTDMKELAELSDTPVRDEVTEDSDNERLRNENAEEGDTEDLGMQLWSNHIIMREIMSHLEWRQQVPCELVCRLWRDVVKSLQLVNLHSCDFMIQMGKREATCFNISLLVDQPVRTRPMCVIGFFRSSISNCKYPCAYFSPAPCDPPCASTHSVIETVHEIMLSKRSGLLTVNSLGTIYMPHPTSRTFQHITYRMLNGRNITFLGLSLPTIPNVHYRTVQYRSEDTAQEDFYSVVDDICSTDIIKGVLVFAKSRPNFEIDYTILWILMSYIKNIQPSIPYALGGSFVRVMLVNKGPKIESGGCVTMGVFSVPKEPEEPVSCCQFNMYSLIIDSTVEEKSAIQDTIQTFAGNIPELQFSAALQFSSCFRRQRRFPLEQKLIDNSSLNVEQEAFRATFPDTSVLVCYCNGVIGYNHPDIRPPPIKRPKRSSESEPELGHGDSTVFVYFTWGKQRTSGEEAHHYQQ